MIHAGRCFTLNVNPESDLKSIYLTQKHYPDSYRDTKIHQF